MTTMTQEEYAAEHGTKCPCCKSENISGGFIDVEGNTAFQRITCLCGASWYDEYVFKEYSNLETPG